MSRFDERDIVADDLIEAIDVLKEALQEHEQTWGREAYVEGDWAYRAATLVSKYERKS